MSSQMLLLRCVVSLLAHMPGPRPSSRQSYHASHPVVTQSIVELRPKNPVELLKCAQIGSTRAKKYGAEVLALIREAEGLPEPALGDALLTNALPTTNANHKKPWTALQEDGIVEMLEEGQSLKVW